MPSLKVGNNTYESSVDRLPDECPLCHKSITPIFKMSHVAGSSGSQTDLNNVYACPSSDCHRLFISYFRENFGRESGTYAYRGSAPYQRQSPTIFDGIKKLSPSFVEIYCQSLHAEHMSLDQIAGVGFRKSLKFLIKDFCCMERPGDSVQIKSVALGTCIENYVADQNIRDCAKLASWLGNDETHYIRKWDDKDINDLKALLGLTLSWIETSLKTKAYRDSMLKSAT